jgi:hypothetical protein
MAVPLIVPPVTVTELDVNGPVIAENTPVEGATPPMAVPLIVPPVIVTKLDVTAPVYPTEAVNDVNAPAADIESPISVLLIVPPEMVGLVNDNPVIPVTVSSAVPAGLTATNFPAVEPFSAGSLSHPWLIKLNSLRMAAEEPGSFGAGTVPPL